MKFERKKDPRRSINIGAYTRENLLDSINEAMKKSPRYKNYKFFIPPPNRITAIAEWISDSGAYVALKESKGASFVNHPKFPDLYIEYDTGGMQYGNLALEDFLISIGVHL